MRLLAILAGALALACAAPAAAQSPNVGKPAVLPSGAAPGVTIYCDDGTGKTAICASAGGGGGGGDASAANQTTQITAINLTNTRLGDVSAPASGSVNQRLSVLDTRLQAVITALGTPLQAGGAVTISSAALPTGAATATNQVTTNAALGAPADAPWTSGAGTMIGLLKTIAGAAADTSAATVAIDQSVPGTSNAVVVTSTTLPTGAATAANQAALSAQFADALGSGSLALGTVGAAYTISPANGQGTAGLSITGLTGSGASVAIEASNDGTSWTAVGGLVAGTGLAVTTLTGDLQFRLNASGRRGLRLRVTVAGTGTATVASTLSTAPFDPPAPARDGNGDLRVPTVTVTPWFVALTANTSTEILGPSTTRIGYDIQCTGTAAVAISRTHATLSSATPAAGGADLVIPSGTTPYFQPAYVSGLGVTAYTTSAQSCWGVSYARQ